MPASVQPHLKGILVILLWHRRCAGIRHPYGFAIVTVLVLGTSLGIGMFAPVFVHAETTFIPTVILSERYDTNIWFSPAQFLPPGTRLDDIATTIGGYAQVLYKERDVEASLNGGVDFNSYVYNKGLNFISTRLDGTAKLDGWLQGFAKGAQLRVADSFRYTPETPSFFTGVKPGVVEDPFLRGIQQFRANTFSNTARANASYPLFRDLALDGSYSWSLYRVGSPLVTGASGIIFFNTNVNAWSVGPRYVLTRQDSLSLLYQQTGITQKQDGTSDTAIDTTTRTVTAGYSRMMQTWEFGLNGGVTTVVPGDEHVYPVFKMSLSTTTDRVTAVRLDISRQAAPSFFLVGGALLSNLAQVSFTYKLSHVLTLGGNVNYSFANTVPDKTVQFKSYASGVGLNYKFAKFMALDLYYNYSSFQTDQPGSSFTIPRNVVGFGLSTQWK